jgi:type II secretory ATPase GspE/PulE/Tfp pilus assembly ATPase PilB-like protein
VQASLTGHLVLATLHTNDAPGAVTRLIDMGIEPYLLASTLNGVLAQRLVRKLCAECRAPYEPDAKERSVFGKPTPERLYRAGRLRRVQLLRLPRAHRHLRALHRRRRDAPPDPRHRARKRAARARGEGRHGAAARGRAALGARRRDVAR